MPRNLMCLIAAASLTGACASEGPPIQLGPQGPTGGLFISPMGEPFRAATSGSDLIGAWFAKADANGDGTLTVGETQADAARFFGTLDTNRDAELTPPEMIRYEQEVAPEIRLGAQMGRRRPGDRPGGEREFTPESEGSPQRGKEPERVRLPQGAARYGLLDLPQPVAAADSDFDRAVSAREFAEAAAERFALLDRDHDGRITREELEPVPIAAP